MPDEEARPAGAPRARGSTVASHRVYSGRVLNLDVDTVRFPDGSTGPLELIRHSGASAVVPFLDDPHVAGRDARVLLIRQYRYAVDDYVLEIPAGRLDAGETPLECAARELREEAGYEAANLTSLGGFFTTPGFIDEYIHAFQATGLVQAATAHEPDEFIRVESKSLLGALRLIDRGGIVDAKTIIALLKADRLLTR
jgi:ADP-ribose pyrophosphatase